MTQNGVTTELVRIETADGIWLDGAAWIPAGGMSETAIALCHGTGAEFYYPWLVFLGAGLAEAGYATMSLNRRDHGTQFGFHKLDPAARDHACAIDALAARGARRVILAGHSFGTVTAPYYLLETGDTRVPAMLLYAPLGDLRSASVVISGGRETYHRYVATAREMVASGRGDEAFLIPPMVPGGLPLVQTYEVFLDKRGPETRAVPIDILADLGARPMLGVRDPGDPYPATLPPAQERLMAANPGLDYVLLDDIRGGRMDAEAHGYAGREDEVLGITLDWLDQKGFRP